MRLGLVIGEIGNKGKIEVTQEELRNALFEQARRFPGQERMVYEYYQKTPGALAELRAPIFEDKVVDYILAQAKPTDRKVSRGGTVEAAGRRGRAGAPARMAMITHDHDHDHHHGMITNMTIIITTMITITADHDHDQGQGSTPRRRRG